ncbi:hypothetical protein C5167_034726 [Papaver somniferum]|uniref:B box-type domain-containing protein n=1 Tax=Papaver somniferum TaxID=3469 RepID=A0A4Y7KFA5_PAPSO|nr:hypothetical protein C5167_034726 [Papaver somniferum]
MARGEKTQEWVTTLMSTEFVNSCSNHRELKYNGRNYFCIDCKMSLCLHCLNSSPHRLHKSLRIRRNTFRKVVRLGDIKNFFDCSQIQTYACNGAKAIHLNSWPSKSSKNRIGQLYETYACNGAKATHLNSWLSRFSKDDPLCEVSVNSDEESSPTVRTPKSCQNEHVAMRTSTKAASLNEHLAVSHTFRTSHRKRKGVPRRAPFF